ncbi:MAG: hypothetical protein ACLFVT_03155 [Syntrophobacteria bacterium]
MNWNLTELGEIRKFGFVAFIFFGCLCTFALWGKRLYPAWVFGFLSILGCGFMAAPSRLRPLYVRWLLVTRFLGRMATILVLSLAYYLVITPAALIKRIFGGRPLPLSPDKNASSYWVTRSEPAQPRERFSKRY